MNILKHTKNIVRSFLSYVIAIVIIIIIITIIINIINIIIIIIKKYKISIIGSKLFISI